HRMPQCLLRPGEVAIDAPERTQLAPEPACHGRRTGTPSAQRYDGSLCCRSRERCELAFEERTQDLSQHRLCTAASLGGEGGLVACPLLVSRLPIGDGQLAMKVRLVGRLAHRRTEERERLCEVARAH